MIRQNKNGFTLLQLLVVIAIIGILFSMLMAVMHSSREKGRRTSCINNLKELYLIHMSYMQDYDDFLPPNQYVYGPFGDCPPFSWDSVLVKAKYVTTPEVLHCPSAAPEPYEPGRTYGSFVRNPDSYHGFDNILQEMDVDPSRGILLVDSLRVSDQKEVWFFAHEGYGCWQRMHVRHNKTATTLLFDGHTESLRSSELINGRYKPLPEYNYGHWYVWPEPPLQNN